MTSEMKYALITGATSGIGYELAKLFAKDQFNLIIVARGQEGLDRTAAELTSRYGIHVITIAKDLSAPGAAFELYDGLRNKNLDVEVLVNDAGQGQYGEFKDTDIQKELSIIQLNIASLVVLTKLFIRDRIEKGSGKILNLSSIASKTPGPYQSVYHGTKAFVQSFTEALHAELKDHHITVTALLPGATNTDFFNKANMLDSKIVQEGELADPAKVAEDGYKALMSGDDMVVSGTKNKIQVAMSNILPDHVVAERARKQQEPVNGEHKQ